MLISGRRSSVAEPSAGSCFRDYSRRKLDQVLREGIGRLVGTFDKWDATLTFTSPDVTTGVLDIKIQADSVNTGSGMKDGKLKSKDFFDVKEDPLITFLFNEDCTDRSRYV